MFIFTSFQKAIQRATLEMLYKLCFIVLDCIPPNASIILKISINLPFDCISIACRQHNSEIGLFFFYFFYNRYYHYTSIYDNNYYAHTWVLKDIYE